MILEPAKDISNLIYQILESFGYKHPLHPVLVHLPIGLSLGALVLCLLGTLLGKPLLKRSAYHALVLAGLFSLVAMFMGVLDWQHYFNGTLLKPIRIKLLTALIYSLVLSIGVIIGYRQGPESRQLIPVYFLGAFCVTTLGYYGGELTFTGRSPAAVKDRDKGQSLFEANCSSCHPSGGNRIVPNKPIRNSHQLESLAIFTSHVRNPSKAAGDKSIMPSFNPETISDADMAILYAYIKQYLAQEDCEPQQHID